MDPTLETATVTHLRASLLRGLHKDTLRRGGEAAWARMVEDLSPATRGTFLRMPGSLAWLEVAQVNELVAAYLALKRGQDAGLGGLTAEDQFTVVHAWLLKLLNPGLLVRQVPAIFRLDYRGGLVCLDHAEAGHAELSAWVVGLFPEWYSQAAPQWLKRALELSGARACEVLHHPPRTGCRHRFELSWKP